MYEFSSILEDIPNVREFNYHISRRYFGAEQGAILEPDCHFTKGSRQV